MITSIGNKLLDHHIKKVGKECDKQKLSYAVMLVSKKEDNTYTVIMHGKYSIAETVAMASEMIGSIKDGTTRKIVYKLIGQDLGVEE